MHKAIKAGDIKIEESLLIELELIKKPEAKPEAKPKLEAKPVEEGALQEFVNFCRGAFGGSK